MHRSPQISIIILNYNTASFTRSCLNAIYENIDETVREIIVVDNNSTDRTIELLVKEFPSAKFLFKNDNAGFAVGCNYGASKASGKYLLFLNPDVIVKENIFPVLSDFMDGNHSAGVLSGVMYDENNTVQYFYNSFPNLSWEFSTLYLPLLQKKIDNLNSKPEIQLKKNFQADWFHGAFIFIRKDDFNSVGGFNENYFMYYEDVELCFKVNNILKKKNICLTEIKYFHSKKSSLSNEKYDDLYTFHIARSKIIFLSNYGFIKRTGLYLTGLANVLSRMLILPFWKKYSKRKRLKFYQLLKITKLFFSKSYLIQSKFEYIK